MVSMSYWTTAVTDHRYLRPIVQAIAQVFAEICRTKIHFAHRSDVTAGLGSRELGAVKIPVSYDAWRPPKRRKNDSEENLFF